ncbi:hypothetical protein MMC29_000696 [Sticta canariensis]|nr:hypothetical protein [Sticta canariensis]
MSAAEIAMTLGDYETLFQAEVERLFPLESDSPRPTLQQVETLVASSQDVSAAEIATALGDHETLFQAGVERLFPLESDSPRPTLQQVETLMDLSQGVSAAEIAITIGDYETLFQREVERVFPLESDPPRPTLQQVETLVDSSQEVSAAETAMTLGDHETPSQEDIEGVFPLESDSPRPTLQQVETVSKELDAIFGPSISPDFSLPFPFPPHECNEPAQAPVSLSQGKIERLFPLESDSSKPTLQQVETESKEPDAISKPNLSPDFSFLFPSPPHECNEPAQAPVSPELSQTQVNEIYADPWLANNKHQTQDFSPQPRYFYPDPSVNVNQNPVDPYFINAAPVSGAQYQQRQELEPSVNAYPQYNILPDQKHPSQIKPEQSQCPLPQPTQLDFDTTTPDDKSRTSLLSQHESPVQSQNFSQPQSRLSSFDIETPFGPSEFEDSPREIVCNDYPPLESAPVRWDCFEYNQHGELKSGSTYSVEEIERFLFRNPRHFTSHGYSPKHGGLTLWIQQAPRPKNHCHKDLSAVQCLLNCCRQARIISPGELRVAFDEQTRVFPNHNPQHNAGYVHLRCLERFLDFPRICIELIVKGEDRVLAYEGLKRNLMLLQTIQEVDIVDRFAEFCSANRRAPASYPAMDMRKHTRPFQGTLLQEINILGPAPYRDHMQLIWETQGRSGVMAECKRKDQLELQRQKKRANAAVQSKEPAKKRKRRARKPEPESESESGSESESESEFDSAQDDRCELKWKGRKQARISRSKLKAKPVPKRRGKKDLQTRKAELKLQSKRRNINLAWDDVSSPGSELAPTSLFEDEQGGQKRAQEHQSRPRGRPAPNSRSNNNSGSSTNPYFNSGERIKKRVWMPQPEPELEPSTPSNDCTFGYPRRANRQVEKPELLMLPNIKSEWTANNGECDLPRPEKRARYS